MNILKLASVSLLLVSSLSFGYGLKDTQLEIPFNNFIVEPYQQLTAYIPANQHINENIVCLLKNVEAVHADIRLQMYSSNLTFNENDSADGVYFLAGTQTIYLYKYNIQPEDKSYGVYVRFFNYGTAESQRASLTCKYA